MAGLQAILRLNAVTANQNISSLPQSQCKSLSSDSQQVVPIPTWIALELNRKANSQVLPQTSGSSHLRFKEPSRQCCRPSQSCRVCPLEDLWPEGRRRGGGWGEKQGQSVVLGNAPL